MRKRTHVALCARGADFSRASDVDALFAFFDGLARESGAPRGVTRTRPGAAASSLPSVPTVPTLALAAAAAAMLTPSPASVPGATSAMRQRSFRIESAARR